MIRAPSGRYAAPTPCDGKLLAVQIKSAAHCRAWITRRAKWVALRDRVTAMLRAEAAAVQVVF